MDPQLHTPGGAGTGTPFAAFAPEAVRDIARDVVTDSTTGAADYPTGDLTDRAAAFHAGARRGRGNARPRRGISGARRSEPGAPPARPSEH